MLIKKNDVSQKMQTDKALVNISTTNDIRDALVELAQLFAEQDDAIVELANVMMEG